MTNQTLNAIRQQLAFPTGLGVHPAKATVVGRQAAALSRGAVSSARTMPCATGANAPERAELGDCVCAWFPRRVLEDAPGIRCWRIWTKFTRLAAPEVQASRLARQIVKIGFTCTLSLAAEGRIFV